MATDATQKMQHLETHKKVWSAKMIPNSFQGMNFGLGETAEMIRDSVASFASEKIAPLAEDIDKTNQFPRHLWPELGALGLHGITVPEDDGGTGLAILSIASPWRRSAARRLLWGCPMARTPISASTRLISMVMPNRRQRYLPKLISGDMSGHWPCPSRARVLMLCPCARPTRRAIATSSTGQILDHQRAVCRNAYGGLCQDRSRCGPRGITAFLIEKGMKGFSTAQKLDKLGMRGSDTCELVFEDCEVPAENVLGAEWRGQCADVRARL
jgi:isovaleryl-CoA dehydrogenase